MNTNLLETSSTTREHERSSVPHRPNHPRPSRPLDRLAMRVGLALLVWSRRTARRLDSEGVTLNRRLMADVRRESEHADTTRSLLAPR
jgi:hypothetical protein